MSEDQACEVPLIEQLRSIPKDYRTVRAIQWTEDGRETGHQYIPVGHMMHRAADELEKLASRPEAVTIVTEDPLFFYVHDSDSSVIVQRKQPLKNTDNPLSLDERTILFLCRAMKLSAPQEKSK